MWISFPQIALIQFESIVINGIQSIDGGEQPNIRFGHGVSRQKCGLGQDGVIDALQGGKEFVIGRFVNLGAGRKSRLVGSIGNIGVDPIVQDIDGFHQCGGIQFMVRVFGQGTEHRPHHAQYFRRFVIDDRSRDFIE